MSSETADQPDLYMVPKVEDTSDDMEFSNNFSTVNTAQRSIPSEESREGLLQPFTCDVCDITAEAKYLCTDCGHNICSYCFGYHEKYTIGHHVQIITALCHLTASEQEDTLKTKIRKQAKVMESMLSQLAEEKQVLEQQMWAAEDDIDRRFTAGQKVMAEVRDECLASLRHAVHMFHDRLQNETRAGRSKQKQLSQLLSRWDTNSNPHQAEKDIENVLLSDGDLKSYQDRLAKGRSISFFAYKIKESSVRLSSLSNHVRDFMGSLEPSRLTEEYSMLADEPEENLYAESAHNLSAGQSLVLDSTTKDVDQAPNREMKSRLDGMLVMLTQLEERVVALGTENVLLRRELKDFKNRSSQMQTIVTDLPNKPEDSRGDGNAIDIDATKSTCSPSEKEEPPSENGLLTGCTMQDVINYSSGQQQESTTDSQQIQKDLDVQGQRDVQQEVSTPGTQRALRFSANVRIPKHHLDMDQENKSRFQERPKPGTAKRIKRQSSPTKAKKCQKIQEQAVEVTKKSSDGSQNSTTSVQFLPYFRQPAVALVRINPQKEIHVMNSGAKSDQTDSEIPNQAKELGKLVTEPSEGKRERKLRRCCYPNCEGNNGDSITMSKSTQQRVPLPDSVEVKVRSVRIGSMRALATSVNFKEDRLSFQITSVFNQDTYCFEVMVEDLTCIQFTLNKTQPLIFIKVTASCAENLCKILKMSERPPEMFNPYSYDLQKSFIVVIIEEFLEESQIRNLFQHYRSAHPFSPNFLRELANEDANLLLVKSSPPLLSHHTI